MTTIAPQKQPILAPTDNDPRLFFLQIWKATHFDTSALAWLADVPESCVLAMLRYKPVPRLHAEEVLAGLSRIHRQQYSLENVRVKLAEEDTRHAR